VLLLCVTLLVWRPLDFVIELPSTLPSIGQRGVVGIVELLFHGGVAVLTVAAVRALANTLPSALLLARAALVASAAATVQSFYWSVLPHQTMPSDKLPLAALGVVVASAWLIYLRYEERRR
jgi:cytochrome c oxidase assembly factor CtaG